MKLRFVTGLVGAVLTLSPVGFAQQQQGNQSKVSAIRNDRDGIQGAIAFQRAKDRADARQAKLEAGRSTLDHSGADRRIDDSKDSHRVPDPGPAPLRHNKTQ